MRKAVVSFGRMNPPTKGHAENIKQVEKEAARLKADPIIYVSHTQDKKKNPLSYELKVAVLHQLFPKSIKVDKENEVKNMFDILKKISGQYDEVIIMLGEDRAEETQNYDKYNGTLYNFKKITVKSSGERTEGISGTAMREFAAKNDFESFKKNLIPGLTDKGAKEIFDATRKGMTLVESFLAFLKGAL